jgi:hypothetical protein
MVILTLLTTELKNVMMGIKSLLMLVTMIVKLIHDIVFFKVFFILEIEHDFITYDDLLSRVLILILGDLRLSD